MASVAVRSGFLIHRLYPRLWQCSTNIKHCTTDSSNKSALTHTGQSFADEDYRNQRFDINPKIVNPNFAIDLAAEDPIVVCEKRSVFSDGGGALGHPRVFINLDQPKAQICGYSGRRFIQKKYYKAEEHGPSITYEDYMQQMNPQVRDWPN